jgi:general secretion pathway protein K
MKIVARTGRRGIALVIVMMVIVVLGMLAGGFAYSMRVETKLAKNVGSESDMEWIGRSGIEVARYVLAQQLNCPNEPYDSLNQKWAGGPGGNCSSNGPLADVSLEHIQLGRGECSVKIVDLERKVNINSASRQTIQQVLDLMGVDSFDAYTILDSIEDWRDADSNPHVNGAESDYYLTLPQPYVAKDGPLDDLSELLLVRGVTREIYWGLQGASRLSQPGQPRSGSAFNRPDTVFSYGLVDLFTTLGRPQVNINTATVGVLQLLPGVDRSCAEDIVRKRAGLDGVDGTEDDTPFFNTGELINVSCMNPIFVNQLSRYATVRSFTFEAQVDVEIDQYKRRLVALLFRNSSRDVQILYTHWE